MTGNSNGRDDSDGSGGSELIRATKSGELVGVTHLVSLSERRLP